MFSRLRSVSETEKQSRQLCKVQLGSSLWGLTHRQDRSADDNPEASAAVLRATKRGAGDLRRT